jgi:methionyl-tRNA synthetase
MLLAAGENPPDRIFVHGFFTVNGQKMSKTLGNVVDPEYLVRKYGSDGTRYLLLTQFPFGQDGDIQADRFAEKYNSDLANDLGNLVSRTLKMVKSYCQGEIPKPSAYQESDERLKSEAVECVQKVWRNIQEIDLNQAIAQVMKLVRSTNKYVENQAPWALDKEGKKERLDTVLYTSCETLRIISALFYPVLPQRCGRIGELLGFSGEALNPTLEKAKEWGVLKPGTKVGAPESLFPRLEKKAKREKPEPAASSKEAVPEISFDEFSKIDLRVAEVKEAERIKGADKLLKLKIDLGTEERQIVAGIAEQYSPEEMIGKRIVVVTNLKPAKIRGIESKGMLLAGKDGKTLSLVVADKNLKGGSEVS